MPRYQVYTYRDLQREGRSMRSCIGSMLQPAVIIFVIYFVVVGDDNDDACC